MSGVRKALEEAERAVNQITEGECADERLIAAAAIAAFLRALPVGLRGVPGAILDGHAPAIMPHRLAAAVASAAAEGE